MDSMWRRSYDSLSLEGNSRTQLKNSEIVSEVMKYPRTIKISSLKFEVLHESSFQGERRVKTNLIGLAAMFN